MTEVILVLTGLLLGGVAVWFIQGYRLASKAGLSPEQTEELNGRMKDLEMRGVQKDEQIRHLEGDLANSLE